MRFRPSKINIFTLPAALTHRRIDKQKVISLELIRRRGREGTRCMSTFLPNPSTSTHLHMDIFGKAAIFRSYDCYFGSRGLRAHTQRIQSLKYIRTPIHGVRVSKCKGYRNANLLDVHRKQRTLALLTQKIPNFVYMS